MGPFGRNGVRIACKCRGYRRVRTSRIPSGVRISARAPVPAVERHQAFQRAAEEARGRVVLQNCQQVPCRLWLCEALHGLPAKWEVRGVAQVVAAEAGQESREG